MEALYIPNEQDFRKWIKEAIREYFEEKPVASPGGVADEPFLSREEIASKLKVSLVTLTEWVKRGLPSHKQRGRVYFLHSEVMEYIKAKRMGSFKLSRVFEENEAA